MIADSARQAGRQIARSSSGFHLLQSVKGRTAFTIHASNAVEYKGGASAALHDVIITLYGAQGDRSDRISGSEFDYDQKAGIVTAKGEVLIDLQGADLSAAIPYRVCAIQRSLPAAAAARRRWECRRRARRAAGHSYQDQRAGLRPEEADRHHRGQHVEFSTPRGAGQATGATYDVRRRACWYPPIVRRADLVDRNGEPVVAPRLPCRVPPLQHAGVPDQSRS